MPNIRFPLKKPTSGHQNPYTIDFDFLPNPFSPNLSQEQSSLLYTTKISIHDTNIDSSRIEHVFPKGKVYFVINENRHPNLLLNTPDFVDRIMRNTLSESVSGTWIHLGGIEDIVSIRNNPYISTSFVPTAVVYHEIELTPDFFQQLKNLIQNQRFKLVPNDPLAVPADNPIRLSIVLGNWIKGEMGIKITETDINSAQIVLPICTNQILQLGGLMMDGNGMNITTIKSLIPILKRGISNGRLFNTNESSMSNDSPLNVGVIPCPIFHFLESCSLLSNIITSDHLDHPLRELYPSDPLLIESCLFINNNRWRLSGSIIDLPFRNSFLSYKVIINNIQNDLHPSGLFYSRYLSGKTISLFDNVGLNKKTITLLGNNETRNGIDIVINENFIRKNNYLISIGEIMFNDISIDGDLYFNIETNISNLQEFIVAVTNRHVISLTTAECFARTMGFLALSITKYFNENDVEIIFGTGLHLPSRYYTSKVVFIALAWNLLSDDIVKMRGGEAHFLVDNYEDIFESLPDDFKHIINTIQRPFWMNNHGDESPFGGWKHFGEIPDSGGRKDHFLLNAFAVFDSCFSPLIRVAFNFYEHFFDPDKIDKKYNEKGREFGFWVDYKYNPGQVYQKV